MSYRKALGLGTVIGFEEGKYLENRIKKEYEGFCSSYKCCEVKTASKKKNKIGEPIFTTKYLLMIKKTDDVKLDNCPDCGNALFFAEKGTSENGKDDE